MENVIELKSIRDLRGKNAVLLFGKTRAGKSTFINDAYGKKVVESTEGLTSDTNEISYVNWPIRVDDHDVFLVDTIGLGGSGKDHDRLSLAWKWLSIFHTGKDRKTSLEPIVKGILYFIDIADGAINEDNIRNLETFKALVGEEVQESVVFVTTKWATYAEPQNRKRHEKNFVGWGEKIREFFPRVSILRLDDTTGRLDEDDLNELSSTERTEKEREYHNNAMRVLRQLPTKTPTQPILLQREMRNSPLLAKALLTTTLGRKTLLDLIKDLERASPVRAKFMRKLLEYTMKLT
ncbi:P-loop containing nucleoside triphosphate hydrolase protein [Flagelloscypha sp. PMI_526]|nr:P-loop containing nucleoside triphosphate hydrolase protein [Flagelloscypha sp. PMI_526]